MHRSIRFWTLLPVLALIGCGADSADVRTACESAYPADCRRMDVAASCERIGEDAERASCETEALAFFDCSGSAESCEADVFGRCAAEVAAWDRCVDASDSDVCYEVCRESVERGCALQSDQCFGECFSARTLAVSGGCVPQTQAYFECLAALADICQRDTCRDERDALASCSS